MRNREKTVTGFYSPSSVTCLIVSERIAKTFGKISTNVFQKVRMGLVVDCTLRELRERVCDLNSKCLHALRMYVRFLIRDEL